jgi:putative transposase
MQKTQRTFTKEFKQEAVQLVKTSGKSMAQLARDLGIADSTLHHWCKQFSEHGEQAFPGSGHQTCRGGRTASSQTGTGDHAAGARHIKKSAGHLLARPALTFPFIAEQSQQYPITLLCKTLEVSESGYYAWKNREPSQHCREDARLAAEIQQVFLEHRKLYGSPRIHAVLKARGTSCSRKRVARLMQQLGLSAQAKRSRKPTTKSDPHARFAPNHLNREFTAQQPNTKWVTDTKAVETAEGWLFLAVMLDLFSRMVVGWAMAETADTDLTELALRMAVARRYPEGDLMHHSDRGSEFTSDRYLALLAQLGIQVSMSRTANCWDNAAMESFFATLTKECLDRVRFQTRQEARSAIFEYLECFYNPVRLHSTLQYVSPLAQRQANQSQMS